jgi:hypothetical protein
MSADPVPSPVCPRCHRPVVSADLVVFDAGEFVHQACYADTGGVVDLVAAFLRRQPARPSCHTCLSRALVIAFDDARKATTALRVHPGFRLDIGAVCSACGHSRVTIRYVGPAGGP